MFSSITADISRCGSTTLSRLKNALILTGMWAVFGYRFRRWLHTTRLLRLFRWPLKPVAILFKIAADITSNVEIPSSADIGPGLLVPHTGYIVIGSSVVMGRNCTITQGVTIGHARGGASGKSGCPIVGDRVYFGPGSIVIGPITIGHDALIGAGSVVVKPVPPRAVVVGNPARVLALTGSFDMISYPGKEMDPARIQSLAAATSREQAAGSQETFSTESEPLESRAEILNGR